ncbi:MAG: 4Fe-4S binding protein [Planctomycetota bacterium]
MATKLKIALCFVAIFAGVCLVAWPLAPEGFSISDWKGNPTRYPTGDSESIGKALHPREDASSGSIREPLDPTVGLSGAIGGVLIAIGLVVLATAAGKKRTSVAVWRLDHYLAFFRRRKQVAGASAATSIEGRISRFLPTKLFSDSVTGRLGWARRALKWLGPTFVSAPVRRAVQVFCFAVFLWLFFIVCWPYSAAPLTEGPASVGWRLREIDSTTGYVLVEHPAPSWRPAVRQRVFLGDDRVEDPIAGELASFYIVAANSDRLTLAPAMRLSESQLDTLLLNSSGWTIRERSAWPSHYADNLTRKESLPAEFFLAIDPLVGLSTAVATRSWIWSAVSAAMILIACVLIPRGFCGYLCPLGTLIDLFDWLVGRRVTRFRLAADGWWVHLKYYVLLAVMIAAVGGVLVSGYVAAIPVITRAMLMLGEPLQIAASRGWRQIPAPNAGHAVSLALFAAVLCLGLLRPRFWCKYVCPSGAVFSLGNIFRLSERKVEDSCIHCKKCVEICPFDAIKPDFTTRGTDCTLCRTCAGVCPTQAIKFVERWNLVQLKVPNDPPNHETVLGRRGFVSLAAGCAASLVSGSTIAAATKVFGAGLASSDRPLPVRPPGSVPEEDFLGMCIRCGECFKACPYHVIQPMGFEQGLEGLWTPRVVADAAGCAPSCNACGQVCPTGAIRALPLEEKRHARMGLAIVNPATCLPHADRESCQLCVDECMAAGYRAIEFLRVHTRVNEAGEPIEGSGFAAPVVLVDKCVGCGLCQMVCHQFNVRTRPLLDESAIVVFAGPGREDRLLTGSYRDPPHQTSATPPVRYPPSQSHSMPLRQPPERQSADGDDNPFGL